MEKHRWSTEDYALLERNFKKFGKNKGSKKTAEQLGLTERACRCMYHYRLNKLNKSWPVSKNVDKHVIGNDTVKESTRKRRKNLTEEEEFRLAQRLKIEISKNPNNLRAVFKDIAKEFGFKNFKSVSSRWYGMSLSVRNDDKEYVTDFKKKPSYRGNMGTVFSIVGINSTINTKNQEKPTVNGTEGIFARVINWFREMF